MFSLVGFHKHDATRGHANTPGGVMVDWLERSACDTESTGSNLVLDS